MESIKKVIYCPILEHDVTSSFFIEDIKDTNGDIKIKSVTFYECESRSECDDNIIMDCPCFREMKRVEREINLERY